MQLRIDEHKGQDDSYSRVATEALKCICMIVTEKCLP